MSTEPTTGLPLGPTPEPTPGPTPGRATTATPTDTLARPMTPPALWTPAPGVSLWASAFVLAALVLVALGSARGSGVGLGAAARADMVSQAGGFSIMTTRSSNSEEVCVVLDERTEQLFVYKVDGRRSVQLFARESLAETFSRARAATDAP